MFTAVIFSNVMVSFHCWTRNIFYIVPPVAELSVLRIKRYSCDVRNEISKGMSDLFVNSNGVWHFLGSYKRFWIPAVSACSIHRVEASFSLPHTRICDKDLELVLKFALRKKSAAILSITFCQFVTFALKRLGALRQASWKSIYVPNHRVEWK